MFGSAFGIAMTVILVIYAGYYAVNIIKDLYFDKSGEVVVEEAVEEKEVDIQDELKDFTKYDADEDSKIAKARKEAEEAARQREEEGDVVTGEPLPDDENEDNSSDDEREGNDSSEENDSQQPTDDGEKEVSDDESQQKSYSSAETSDNDSSDNIDEVDNQGGISPEDDAEFADLTQKIKDIPSEPGMSGAIEVDAFDSMDDAQFEQLDMLVRRAAA